MTRQPAAAPAATVPPLLAFVLAVVILYFARQILVPLALALLFAFLLSPVVESVQRLRVPRVPSVFFVLLIAFGAVGGIAWTVTDQLIDIINELPQYRENIHAKIVAPKPRGVSRRFYGASRT